jgi:spore germination protein (amino acid permease)
MNKTDGKMTLTAFQLTSSLVGVMVCLGPLFISRVATKAVGRDAWIIILLAGSIMLINSVVLVHLAKQFPQQTFVEYSQLLFGKWLGRLLAVVQLVLAAELSSITLWYTGQVINVFILFQTPAAIITLSLMGLSYYAGTKGLNAIGRVTEIIFVLSFGFALFFVPPVISYGHLSFIRPFAEHIGLSWFGGIWAVLFCFAGYEMVLTFYPFLKESEKPKMTKHMVGHMVYVAVIFVLAVLTQQMVFPIPYLQKLWLPSIHYVSLVELPILERSDLIFILFWFCVFFKSNMVFYYRTVIDTQLLFHIQSPKWVLIVLAILIYVGTFQLANPLAMEHRLILVMQITMVLFLVLPPLSFLLMKLRGLPKQ